MKLKVLVIAMILASQVTNVAYANEEYTKVEKQYITKGWREGNGYTGYNEGYTYEPKEDIKNDWLEDNGDWFYVDNNGNTVSMIYEIDNVKYYFDTHGVWLNPESEKYIDYMNSIEEIYNAYINKDTNYVFHKENWNMDDYFNILGIINDIKFDNIVDNTFELGITYDNNSIVIKDNSYTQKNREFYGSAKEFISTTINNIEQIKNEEDKIAYINDVIIDNFDYDYSLQNTGSGYLEAYRLGNKIVCSGYATIFSDLCNRTGFKSDIITGVTAAGEAHAWNYVKVNGKTKYIDVCWNDTSGNNRKVFLVPLRQISQDHIAY